MANNKKKNLNYAEAETNYITEIKEPPKKKRGNPNFLKKQNETIADIEEKKEELIEEIANNQINDNIIITDDDYNNSTNENFDSTCASQETSNKKERNIKKNSSLYELLSRPFGASMEELEKELNWKKASIRGTISNLQKEQQFCLLTINIIKPNLEFESNFKSDSDIKNNKSFYKETRYFIKDCKFTINEILKK
jgi:hypothetical protein